MMNITVPVAGDYKISLPAVAGYWIIGSERMGLKFPVTDRPRLVTRLLCRWLFEWVWVDEKGERK